MVETNNPAALEFLHRWLPAGPWVLTAIKPDRTQVDTQTFYPKGEAEVLKYLERYNGTFNIYFHVNRPIRDIKKKANREDIKSLDWLHVDIDPRAGEDIDEERKRALELLTTNLPDTVPPPTCIVFSGGGYQGFWRLEEPLPIEGDLDKAEEAKRYNIQLELLFRADNCHNIDRIMRLPGTINVPDAKKRKKGRVPTLAELVDFNDHTYDLASFSKSPQLQTPDMPAGGSQMKVKVTGEVERIQEAAELDQWDMPNRFKIIMAQGRIPDEPKEGDDSRSAWLYDFCCGCVRHEVPDDVLYAIITDPGWGISESVVEHKSNMDKYAIRQIQRAKESEIDPWLTRFNDKYFVVKRMGGKCLVLTEDFDPVLKRSRLVKMTLTAFQEAHENESVKVGEDSNGLPKFQEAGKWWRKHPNRRQYESITFAPELEVPNGWYNMWQGFAHQPVPGDCSLFLDHVKKNICDGNEQYYDYIMGWMARAVQHPARPGEVAIVLRGGRGVGKGLFARMFGELFGRHYMQISNSSHLVGNFNAHIRDLVVLFADEAFFAGDKKHESILKTLITESTMAIEAKGIDVEAAPNFIHLIMASNDPHVIPAGSDERRFFALEVGGERKKDRPYFKSILKQMREEGGLGALLHQLRTMDLTEFEVRDVPDTKALGEQKILSMAPEEEWWFEKLISGQLVESSSNWPAESSMYELHADYIHWCRIQNVHRPASKLKLGHFLARVLPKVEKWRQTIKVDIVTPDGYSSKKSTTTVMYSTWTLDECRAFWVSKHGRTEWDRDGDQRELDTKDPF